MLAFRVSASPLLKPSEVGDTNSTQAQ